jgi:protein tyrosine/serine phosphatase
MTINLTPAIQSQIYMDKKDAYMLNMIEALTPKIEYQNEKKTKESESSNDSDNEKKEPFFKESEFTFNSYMNQKNINSSIGSTGAFFDTLSSAGGSVQKAS